MSFAVYFIDSDKVYFIDNKFVSDIIYVKSYNVVKWKFYRKKISLFLCKQLTNL